jgi:formylglycine-generating enzyme required for sulfatase activity
MKLKTLGLFLCTFILFGCGPKTAQPYNSLSLKQVMEWVIDPNADVVWESVKSISTAAGTTEIYPRTDAQWEAIRNSAATLMEAGNILMLEGRAKDDKQWMEYSKRFSRTAEVALKAAQDKNKEALFDAGGNIYNACKACHDQYADFDKQPAK